MTFDEQRRILVQTILEDPENDEARLIYADFLQQQGDPRGELIAMQTRLARQSGDEVEASERQLLDDHEATWLGPWHQRALHWRFRRGFLQELKIPLKMFVEVASALDPLSDHLAHVRHLHFTGERYLVPDAEHADRVAAIVEPLRLDTLALELELREVFMTALARGRFLAHVSRLQIVQPSYVAPSAFAPLWRSPHLDNIAALELREARNFNDAVLVDIAESRRWQQVRRFSHVLKYSEVTNAAVAALVTRNRKLTHLDLTGHYGLTDDAFLAIAQTAPPLVELSVAYGRVTDAAIGQIARLDTLRSLDVRHTLLGDDGIGPILALPHLETLNIAHTRMTAVAARRLLREAKPALRDVTITIQNLDSTIVDLLRSRFELHRWR